MSRLNEETLENRDEIGRRWLMIVIGERPLARSETLFCHCGFRSENEQMRCHILHRSFHGRLRNSNGRHGEGFLATRLRKPRSGSRIVTGIFLMRLRAATSLLRDGYGRRGV